MTPNFKLESHLQLLLKKESQVHDFLRLQINSNNHVQTKTSPVY